MFSLQVMWCHTARSKMYFLFKNKEKCEPCVGIFSDEHDYINKYKSSRNYSKVP